MAELLKWLEEIDLQEYIENFQSFGATKVKHLKDLTEEDLRDKLKLKELEIRMFQKNVKLHEGDQKGKCTNPGIVFPLPHSAFGHSVATSSEDSLKKEYKDLYFEAPQGLKQRTINSFILPMCAAAHWRYKSKRELFDWARKERDLRWTMKLTFTDSRELENESEYYKGQSLLWRLEKLSRDLRHVHLMLGLDKPVVHLNKFDQVLQYAGELTTLLKWAEDAEKKIEGALEGASGKKGRKEEEAFWGNLQKKVAPVIKQIQIIHQKAKSLESAFRSELPSRGHGSALGQAEKTQIRLMAKNRRKSSKRKVSRAELVAQQGSTKKKQVVRGQPLISSMKCIPNNECPTPSPIKCICYRFFE